MTHFFAAQADIALSDRHTQLRSFQSYVSSCAAAAAGAAARLRKAFFSPHSIQDELNQHIPQATSPKADVPIPDLQEAAFLALS